ncbi:hypothetical protein BaRGS_00028513 [Batillaria attramentaria]
MVGVAAIPPQMNLSEEFKRLATCLDVYGPPVTRPQLDGCYRSLQGLLQLVLQRDKYAGVLERGEVLLRLACDGAKITKHKDSVRATIKVVHGQRDELTPENGRESKSPSAADSDEEGANSPPEEPITSRSKPKLHLGLPVLSLVGRSFTQFLHQGRLPPTGSQDGASASDSQDGTAPKNHPPPAARPLVPLSDRILH